MVVGRLANSVTLCDDNEVFFLAAGGQVRMAANSVRPLSPTERIGPEDQMISASSPDLYRRRSRDTSFYPG
jgi:hypothetical protein